jgi:hypothetical protein
MSILAIGNMRAPPVSVADSEALGERHLALVVLHRLVAGAAVGTIILVPEGDAVLVEGDEPAVGDGDAVATADQAGSRCRRSCRWRRACSAPWFLICRAPEALG